MNELTSEQSTSPSASREDGDLSATIKRSVHSLRVYEACLNLFALLILILTIVNGGWILWNWAVLAVRTTAVVQSGILAGIVFSLIPLRETLGKKGDVLYEELSVIRDLHELERSDAATVRMALRSFQLTRVVQSFLGVTINAVFVILNVLCVCVGVFLATNALTRGPSVEELDRWTRALKNEVAGTLGHGKPIRIYVKPFGRDESFDAGFTVDLEILVRTSVTGDGLEVECKVPFPSDDVVKNCGSQEQYRSLVETEATAMIRIAAYHAGQDAGLPYTLVFRHDLIHVEVTFGDFEKPTPQAPAAPPAPPL